MTKARFIIASVVLGTMAVMVFSNFKSGESPSSITKSYFIDGLEVFHQETQTLQQKAMAYADGELELNDLKAQFYQTRLAFKRIEFLLDYLQPQDVKD